MELLTTAVELQLLAKVALNTGQNPASRSQKPTWIMQNDRIIIMEWFGVEGTWIIQFYPLPWAGMDWGGGHTHLPDPLSLQM